MSLSLPLKQILGAVIILIGLGFVSSAQAHTGHHRGQVATVGGEASAPAAQNQTHHEQTVAATTHESRNNNDRNCVGGCCGNAQCAACGLVLGSAVPEVAPLDASVRALFSDVTVKSGIGPQELSRPPRSFV